MAVAFRMVGSRAVSESIRHRRATPVAGWADFEVTDAIAGIPERRPSLAWILAFLASALLSLVLVRSLVQLVGTGVGIWGNSQAIVWAWDITGFVFWIGIGHAGTLISAVLYLFRQHWRVSMSRTAEAMTLIAVATASIYPIFHLGRLWLSYWVLPVPNQMGLWPNFKSPLVWDAFAIMSYFLVSAMFWYLGLVPDLATMRDRATDPGRRRLWSRLSLGWRGSQRHWRHHEAAYMTLAGLCTALVISVHSIVSLDFAVTVIPGWHSTLFPPYFVAGAVLSGSAMVVLLMSIMRRACHLEGLITTGHLDAMNRLVLAAGTMVAYAYGVEWLLAFIGDEAHERATLLNRAHGPDAWAFWVMMVCNVVLPQLYWSRWIRRSMAAMTVVSLGVTLGMWLERYVIIVSGLDRCFLPAAWERFSPTLVDVATFAGTVGLFSTAFLLFLRFVPAIAMSEIKAQRHELSASRRQPVAERAHLSQRAEPGTAGVVRLEGDGHDVVILGRYLTAKELVCGCRALTEAGVTAVDGHAPFSVPGFRQALGLGQSPIPMIALLAGLMGACVAIGFQYWTQGTGAEQVLGGKSAVSWQTYVPVAFEVGILSASVAGFVAVWWICRLPESSHPVLRLEGFSAASTDGFFASVQVGHFDSARVAALLESTGAYDLVEVLA